MKKCLIVWLTLVVSLSVLPFSVNASSSRNVEITTPDRSLEAKFLKAYRSGEYVVVEMLFQNVTDKDYSMRRDSLIFVHYTKSTHRDGFLGYVQGTGKDPSAGQPVTYDKVPDFEDFGVGCFLLGATEYYKLLGDD